MAVERSGPPARASRIECGFPSDAAAPRLVDALQSSARRSIAGGRARFSLTSAIVAHAVQHGLKPLPGVHNLIAVASGKGGVGKSTVAVNIALALAAEGARVGNSRCGHLRPEPAEDVGLIGRRPETKDGKTLEPLEAHGLEAMSIGFLVDEQQPMAWRGPMVTSALNQLLMQTNWGDLDYLIVDMPPGTGDIQLTLAQRVPVSGAVIVTTPQDIALADARKRPRDVSEGPRAGARGRREHERAHLPVAGTRSTCSASTAAGLEREYGVPLLGTCRSTGGSARNQ